MMISTMLYKKDQSNFDVERILSLLKLRFFINNIYRNQGFLIEFECGKSERTYKISMSELDAIFIASEMDYGVYEIISAIDDATDGEINVTNMDYAFDIPLSQVTDYDSLMSMMK